LRLERLEVGEDPQGAAAQARALAPGGASVSDAVAGLIAAVRDGGDAALRELVARHDGGDGGPVRMSADELAMPLAPVVEAGVHTAIANVMFVASAAVSEDTEVTMPQGHRIVLREIPVRRAGVYVPGGRTPLPSTLVMGVVTARAAGVEEVCVATPPPVHPVLRGVATVLGVTEVYAMGGAHAVAALAYGTDEVQRVDVICGPGNLYSQEAKRQVSGVVGIDGFYGPSDVLVLADETADPRLVALDLLAQGEHGPETVVAAASDDVALLDAIADSIAELAPARPSSEPAAIVLARAPTMLAALAFAEAFGPEHLELVGPRAERLAPRVRCAGAVFVGASGATAFGDYVAGSNHCLPTGGAARFASGLSPRAFRRRVSQVHLDAAVGPLATAGAALARAEGLPVHAESMEARVRQPTQSAANARAKPGHVVENSRP
jgi:histidinol dehydrogenase